MSEESMKHPESDELRAFGLGQLGSAQAEQIAEHLDECSDCCDTILNLQDDTFVELVRDASQPAETVIPAGNSSGDGLAELPEGLQGHPRYDVIDVIGRGGMGYVYRARHRMMDRMVALKIISRRVMALPGAVDRFHREVKATAQLSHPNVVTAHDAEQVNDTHFLVMEYVDGVDLAQLVSRQGALPFTEACDCIRQAALGLQYAQEQNMVHRDVKPQNLMLTDDGTVKILDFGLASLVPGATSDSEGGDHGGQLTEVGSIVGTPDYMSPEQAQDAHQADIRSDIYSLGLTLYFLLVGRSPFAGLSVAEKLKAHANGTVDLCSDLPSEVPQEVIRVLERMTATDPAERYQEPVEVAAVLHEFATPASDQLPLSGVRQAEAEPAISPRPERSGPPRIWRYLRRVWYTTVVFAALATTAFLISMIVPKILQASQPMMVTGGTCVGGDGWWFQSGMVYLPEGGPGLLLGMHEGPSGSREVRYAVLFHHNATPESAISAAVNSGTSYGGGIASVVDGITIDGKAVDLTMSVRLDKRLNKVTETKMTFNGTEIDYSKGRVFVVDLTGEEVTWSQAAVDFPDSVPSPRGLTEVKTLVPEFAKTLLAQDDVNELLGQSRPRHSASDDQLNERLAADINKAAGVPVEQWEKFATDRAASARGIIGHPLSVALLSLPNKGSKPEQKEFRYLHRTPPQMSEIHQAMAVSIDEGFVSLLQPGYIRDIRIIRSANQETVSDVSTALRNGVDGSLTLGVKFVVPELLQGEVECRLRFDGPRMYVDQFRLPARDLTITLDKDGNWKQQEGEEQS